MRTESENKPSELSNQIKFSFFVLLSLGLGSYTASAQKQQGFISKKNELLIRFKSPQKDVQAAYESLLGAMDLKGALPQEQKIWAPQKFKSQLPLGGKSQIKNWVLGLKKKGSTKFNQAKSEALRMVSQTEGLVRLRFSDELTAYGARKLLEKSGLVESVVSNQRYLPAMTLKVLKKALTTQGGVNLLQNWTNPGESLAQAPKVQVPLGKGSWGQDPLLANDWVMPAIGFDPQAWDYQDESLSPVTVAVIDTGVDYNHEDLVAGMWRSERSDRVVGFDFAHGHARPFDQVHFDFKGCLDDFLCSTGLLPPEVVTERYLTNAGHGTHCAGHVGAVANNGMGIYGVGAGAKTSVMALKFFYDYGEEGAGSGDDAAAIAAIDYAIERGVRVINASWGAPQSPEEAESSELRRALERARDAGVLVVVAAGNEGINQDAVSKPFFPAKYDLDNLIVVAASDSEDRLAGFSNYGAESVHIAAPGVRVLSTVAGGGYSAQVASHTDADGNVYEMDWEGTSMAAPLVAGAAARIWARYPWMNYREVRELLLSTARYSEHLEGKVKTAGILDLGAALAVNPNGDLASL